MNYATGAAALIGLCLSGVLFFATLSWMVNRAHTRLTSAWLVGLAFLVVLQSLEFLYHATDLFTHWPFFLKLIDPLVVLLPLCLYGYIQALQGRNLARPRRRLLLHASPALLVALLDLPYWSLPGDEKVAWMLKARLGEDQWTLITPYGNQYLAIIAALCLGYWLLQHRQGYRGRKSRLGSWLAKLQGVQLLVAASLTGRILLSELAGLDLSVAYTLAPVSAYLLYLVLSHAQLPTAMVPKAAAPGKTVALAVPQEDEGLALLFADLEQALAQGAFRDNELSLGKLAALCGMTSHQASAAINQCSGAHFYDWVNQYRVQAAQQALAGTDTPVARICYEVGFNTKSTFNTAFRRLSGCTPTQYRRQHGSNAPEPPSADTP